MKDMNHMEGNIKAAMVDIDEKRRICQMCQNTECPQERKDKFKRDYKARSCSEFKFERRKWIFY